MAIDKVQDLCNELRGIAIELFGPPREGWKFGKVSFGDHTPHTLYWPDDGVIDIELSLRARDDILQLLFQLSHEVCHTLHPSRDEATLEVDVTSVLNEGISTWFSYFVCNYFGQGEQALISIESSAYHKPYLLVAKLIEADFENIKKLRTFQPFIDRLIPGDFAKAGVIVSDKLEEALLAGFLQDSLRTQ